MLNYQRVKAERCVKWSDVKTRKRFACFQRCFQTNQGSHENPIGFRAGSAQPPGTHQRLFKHVSDWKGNRAIHPHFFWPIFDTMHFFCWLVDILPISFRATSPTVPLGGPNKWLNGPSSWLLLGLRSPSCSLNHLDTPKPGDLKTSSNRTKMGLDIKGLSNWYKLMRIRRIGASSCTFFGRKKRRKDDGKVWWAWRLQLNMVEPYMIFQDFRASFYLENPSNLHTVLEAVVFDDSPSAHLRSQRRPCTTEGSR